MMTIATLVLGAVIGTGGATAASAGGVDSVTKKLRSFCREHEFTDGAMWSRAELGMRFVTEYGQDGRQALLRLAREYGRDSGCALEILRTASDADAVPIAREILRGRRAPVYVEAEALVVVAQFQDTASFDAVLGAFRSGDEHLVGPAAYALGNLRDPRGWAELRAALKQAKYARETRAIVRGMGQPGHEEAAPLIVEAVAGGKDTASSGCESLWRIGGVAGRRAAITLLDRVHPIQQKQIAEQFRASLREKSGAEPSDDVAADTAALDRIIKASEREQPH